MASTLSGQGKIDYPVVLVGGTNGKGSTSVFAASISREAGYGTGLFTSPALGSPRSMMKVHPKMMSRARFAEIYSRLASKLSASSSAPYPFEILLAIALIYFREEQVELGVFEIGKGGLRDIVNRIEPTVSVITSVSLDHAETFGSDLSGIAKEKAGIMRPGIPVVIAPQKQEVRDELLGYANEIGATCIETLPNRIYPVRIDRSTLGLRGRHQIENAQLAALAMAQLQSICLRIPLEAFSEGLATARWPCRLECIREKPKVVIDGAHNPAGMSALMAALREEFSFDRLHVVFGCERRKEFPAMLATIAESASSICLVEYPGVAGPSAGDLYASLPSGWDTKTTGPSDLGAGLSRTTDRSRPLDLICVTGSLAGAWEARCLLLGD